MLGIKRQPATRSVIGAGMRVQGPCTFSDGLQIDGEVLGDVTAEGGQPSVLVIGEGGSVEGAISADHVVIGGTVVGPVLARELLELQSKARLQGDVRVVGVQGLNARAMTAESLLEGCEAALSEELVQDHEDNDTQPVAPYSWMRNGGLVDEEYDDSDDAKEQDVEAFKAERAAKARARAEGTLPVVRQRRAGREDVQVTPVFDLVTGDLSFISLTLVLPALVPLLAPQGDLVMLIKPQFELQPGQVGKGGIVRDESLYAVVEQRIRDCCATLGLEVRAWIDSPIQGGDGNREFFVHARRAA